MAKYLDGIQETIENVPEMVKIASGTVTVGTNQYPTSTDIVTPPKNYKNYVLVMYNKSGQNINNIQVQGKTTILNSPIPNSPVGTILNLKISVPGTAVANNSGGVADLTSEEPNPFIVGSVRFLFSLSAAPTSGTIDWALIGY